MEIQGTVVDFNNLCRLCLTQESVMSSIYSEQETQSNTVPLPLRIMACVSIDVRSSDCLPSQICGTCLCQVDGWYKFKDLCENADAILKRFSQNEPIQLESITQVQEMARHWKSCFSLQPLKNETSISTPENEEKRLGPRKKPKSVENSKEDGNRLYTYLKYGVRSPDIKQEDSVSEWNIENMESHQVRDSKIPVMDDLDNVALAHRLNSNQSSANSFENNYIDDDCRDDVSSDDSHIPLVSFKKKVKIIPVEKYKKREDTSNNVSKTKVRRMLKKEAKDAKEQKKAARTIQTQTGIEQDFQPGEIIEREISEQFKTEEDQERKKKIKSIRTQTPKEKSPPKKRVRIRPAIPSACTLCDKVYKNSEILRQHMKSHHVTGTIECPTCKMTFTSLRSLKYHEQRKHSNLEPVPCSFCGKKFLDKKYLRIHENIHSQTNQYVCQFCGRKFIMKTNLTVHISRHHSLKTNDFICQVCGKAFPFKLYLKKHFKTHTDFKPHACTFCDAKFREKTLLRKHVNSIHLKLRPFLCQYCHKTFTRGLYLREHMESQHLGIQKKIECLRCGENFQNRNRLRQHECEGHLEVH